MPELEELLRKKYPSTGLFVIGDHQGSYYVGHYGEFSNTKGPKLYRNVGHAKNAIHGLAEPIWRRLFEEPAERDLHKQAKEEGWDREKIWQEGRKLLRWYNLTKEEKQAFENEHFEIIEIEFVDRKLIVKQ